MENAQQAAASARRPIQESRLKGAARQLSDWTGITLSESQEITARAFGATSWQALLKAPTFVPDEAISGFGDNGRTVRYQKLQHLLAHRLHVSPSLALFLATLWQPTALRADSSTWIWRHYSESKNKDWRVVHAFPEHASLPADVVAVLAASVADNKLALMAVPSCRLARFIDDQDAFLLDVNDRITHLIETEWIEFPEVPLRKRISNIEMAVKKKGAISLHQAPVSDSVPSVRLKAPWLIRPSSEIEIQSAFATLMPWKLDDYPGITKGAAATTFWSMKAEQFSMYAKMAGGTIFFLIYEGNSNYTHSEVQAGVGGLRYMTPSEKQGLWNVREAGYYLVKYGNQVRGHSPIPGMDAALAKRVREATGLGTNDDGPIEFFSSDAGLALTKWAATFPSRARNHGLINTYTGDWRDTVQRRMEFELARAGATF